MRIMILNALNSGNIKSVDRFIGSRLANEFSFSYPALLWVLMVKENEPAIALLVSEGKYIEEIPVTQKYIGYIRDVKIAKKLYSRFPDILPADARLRNKKQWNVSIGYIYWFLVEGRIDYNKLNYKSYQSIAATKDMKLIKKLFPLGTPEEFIYSIFAASVDEDFIEAVEYLLSTFPFVFEDADMIEHVYNTIDKGNITMLKIIIDSLQEDNLLDLEQNMNDLWYTAINSRNIHIVEFFLEEPLFNQHITKALDNMKHDDDISLMKEILHLILPYLSTKIIIELLKSYINRGSKEEIKILLQKPNITIPMDLVSLAIDSMNIDVLIIILEYLGMNGLSNINDLLTTAITLNNIEAFALILQYSEVDLRDHINKLLKRAIDYHRKEIITLLLSAPRIKETVIIKSWEEARNMI